MGNDQTTQIKHKLSDYKIPENYYENCHPNFLDFNINQVQPFLLTGYFLINSQNQKWRQRLDPLLKTKYILAPCRIVASESFFQEGCCSVELSDQIDKLNISYQPFIYSLSREITSRKQKNRLFTEQQLWKIIKYLTKALIQWHSFYPFEKIMSIMPQNIVINYKGNMRIVTQYSFPKQSFFHKPKPIYQPSADKTSSVIKYSNIQPNRFKILSSDLYAIGMTVLDCLILERNQEPQFINIQQKLICMYSRHELTYSKQLKSIIETLLSQDYKKRPNPHDLVNLAQINQTKFA